ncbi:DUF5067 domain-containing protein [Companilactobacillus sp. HBUAS59699]|uniref:DUF5067 domain-containing protein n=1 Tax=Companilactobacillus sp. HBUAS59699 TaxID=3109358 RepID=UPI002FF2D769
MDRRTNRENRNKRSNNTPSRSQRNVQQREQSRSNNITGSSRAARGAKRRQNMPFYQKNSFIISMIIAAIVVIAAGVIIWRVNASKKTTSEPNNIEKVQSSKKKTPKKAAKKKKAEKQEAQKAKNETNDTNNNEQKNDSKDDSINNAGTYNKLSYDTDWFTFKLSNDVKLVKNANGEASLLVKYNYTNKTQTAQVPQQVQANYIILKQDDKQLEPTSATGDYADLINATNTQQVQPGKSFDGALLVKVDNTDSDVNMYFRNIKTNDLMDTMQPFKLK